MTNYLDEYNKRMTYGNAMGFNASPLAQTAHMHADRDRQQQTSASHSGNGYTASYQGGDLSSGFPLAGDDMDGDSLLRCKTKQPLPGGNGTERPVQQLPVFFDIHRAGRGQGGFLFCEETLQFRQRVVLRGHAFIPCSAKSTPIDSSICESVTSTRPAASTAMEARTSEPR